MFERAVGYKTRETKVFLNPRDGRLVTLDVDLNFPPSEKAQQFWLWNRDPERWKNKRDEMKSMDTNEAAADLRAALAEMDKSTQGGGSK